MVRSTSTTPEAYLRSLTADQREVMSTLRDVILKNLPEGYVEAMNWGMLCYEIPLSTYPDTYNKQPLALAALAVQKNYYALYLMNIYWDDKTHSWFLKEWEKSGKKLDMGKSCFRFKRLSDLPLELIGKAIARTSVEDYLEHYELTRNKKKRKK
jgi:hypothetical protein